MKMDGQGTEHKSVMSIVGGWFKSGLVEISCSSKVGHIRLMLTRLKNDRNKVSQKLGMEVFSLLEKGELKIPGTENLFLELRQINKTILVREAEIEQILKDKEIRLLEASGESVRPTPPPKPSAAKPAARKTPVKKAAAAPAKKTNATAGNKKTVAKSGATAKKKPAVKKAAPTPKPVEKTAASTEKKAETTTAPTEKTEEKTA
jgi:hypothetical protein